jgi:Anti-sigma-K factor rskA, C-terminal
MLSDRDIELAHPEAFDFVAGNLPVAERAEFSRHLEGCRYCQGVVNEYTEIGQIIKSLPPHVEPLAGLEERTVAGMVTALAEQRGGPGPAPHADDEAVTQLHPIPWPQPPAEDQTWFHPSAGDQPTPSETTARPMVTGLPLWRRHRGRLAAVVAIAAALIAAAIVIPLSLRGRSLPPGTVVIPLHATAAGKMIGFGAAAGQATARQDGSGSWDVTLSVHGLKNFGDSKWYECWYVGSEHRQLASAGTFLVPGSGTFSMTSAVDPHDFPTMDITIGPPSADGAFGGTVILSGQALGRLRHRPACSLPDMRAFHLGTSGFRS